MPLSPEESEATRQKMRNTRDMGFSRWTGQMVGRHLYTAGMKRMNGQRYEFPGYMRFPFSLFE